MASSAVLRINSSFIYEIIGTQSMRVDIISTGAEIYSSSPKLNQPGLEPSLVYTWTCSGENTFLGFSTSSSASSPDDGLAIGNSVTYSALEGNIYLYSVETIPSVITEYTKVLLLNNNAVVNNGEVVVSSADEFVSGSQTITKDGIYDVTNYAEVDVNVGGGSANLQSSKSYTVAASGSQTISPDSGYDGMEEVALTVPAGTAGTPSATKGTVSNHSVTVTPSVTNTAGYISGGTVNGTPVTVTASELISFSTIRTGSETPSSSLGVDGDIYIQTSGGS